MPGKVKVRVSGRLTPDDSIRWKKWLERDGISYKDVATRAGVSWHFVWAVLNGRKVSAKVLAAARDLVAAAKSA